MGFWVGWRRNLQHLLVSLSAAAFICAALALVLQSAPGRIGAAGVDTDGDGWKDADELAIGTDPNLKCGRAGWPADLVAQGFQPDALNIQDMASFITPVRRLGTGPGDRDFDPRWDLAPGSVIGAYINIADIAALTTGSTGYPPMFNGQRAFGRACSDTSTPAPTPSPTATSTSTPSPTPSPTPTPGPPANGFRGHNYFPASGPTAEKPQSKLWYNDGIWWAIMFVPGSPPSGEKFYIHRLDPAAQTWTNTGTEIDSRNGSNADALWNGSKLYVVTAGVNPAVASDEARFMRYSYNAVSDTYSQDAFATILVSGGMEAIVLAQDTTGKLWVTYTRPNPVIDPANPTASVYVAHTTTNDFNWTAPFVLPVDNAANLLPDDISTVVTYQGRIGIMWSNQATMAFYFATHVDGAAETEWTLTTAYSDPHGADDHINLKSLEGDPAGRVFAAVKSGANGANHPAIILLVLGTDGTWTNYRWANVSNNHTRPVLLIDEQNRNLYLFAAAPCCSGGTIYVKQTSLDAILFPPGLGTPFIQSSSDNCINNPASTKQNVNGTTDLVVLASADCTDFYLHNRLDLAAP